MTPCSPYALALLCLAGLGCAYNTQAPPSPSSSPGAATAIGATHDRAAASPTARTPATTPSTSVVTGRRAPGALDVDGDGLSDIVLSETGDTDRLHVYLGRGGLASDPASQTLLLSDLSAHDQLRDLVHPGDIDGDGFSDLVVVTSGGAQVLHGGPRGLVPHAAQVIVNPDGEVNGVRFLAAGDVDGDGHADLLGSVQCVPAVLESFPPQEIKCSTDEHHFYVWHGSPDGLQKAPRFADHFGRGTGGEVSAVGDVDGDGFDDVLRTHDRQLTLHRGSASGLQAAPGTMLAGPRGKRFDVADVSGIGDVDGDGFADVMAFAYGPYGDPNRAFVYLGSGSGLPARPSQVLRPPHKKYFHLGLLAATALGDVDGDGFGDVAVGDFDRIAVYRGGTGGLSRTPAWSLVEPAGAHNFGTAVGPGDIDGDGFADLWSAAPASGGPTGGDLIGHAYVYRGGPSGPAAAPDRTLVGARGRLGDFAMWFATGSPR